MQLFGYRQLGLWSPGKVEYADAAKRALKQFTNRFARGYIGPDGGWTKRGKARSH